MKLKFGALVVAGSGKIGGHVASKNRGGAYLRTKVTPSNPRTALQSQARGILGSLSTQWGLLTEAQRKAWNDAVANFSKTDIFGDIKNPSGINLFVKLNANLINSGQAQLTLPPVKLEIPSDTEFNATFSIAGEELTITSTNGGYDDVICRVQSSGPVPQGVTNVNSKLRTITSILTGNASAGLYSAYSVKFGAPVLGQKIYVSVAPILATGQIGTPILMLATVIA